MIVGIDIGGTFTDLVCSEEGQLRSIKVPSTPSDFSVGFSEAVSGLGPGLPDEIIHGTTVATNALIQRRGARVGLITTRGFRDVLSLRRRDRRSVYGLETTFQPLIQRSLRREVEERSDGKSVLTTVNPEEIVAVASSLVEDGVEAILVAFLHSATCSDNEAAAAKLIGEHCSEIPVFASHALSDATTEFERFSTGSASAYVAPILHQYLDAIEERLGQPTDLQIVTSDGGLISPEDAKANPIRTALSGPAAGVWGAKSISQRLGYRAFVACDMGGTSFDACLVDEGEPALTRDRQLGFGLPLALEMLDIATIGAGGGSIVSVSSVGTVEVGPEGVGADPGPACYGNQVHQATVTDADLVLGRIPDVLHLPGGSRALDADAARKTLNERVASPIGVSVEEAALLVLSTVEEKMADQIRLMATSNRTDVTDHVLIAYGGAGPLHAAGIATSLGIQTIAIPPEAGLFSAWGGLLASRRSIASTVREFSLSSADGSFEEILKQHTSAAGSSDSDVAHTLDFRCDGSTRVMSVRVGADDQAAQVAERAVAHFGLQDQGLVGMRLTTSVVEHPSRSLDTILPDTSTANAREPDARDVMFEDGVRATCPVIDRGALRLEDSGIGPCIIEEAGATTVVPPGFRWRIGELLMLFLETGK